MDQKKESELPPLSETLIEPDPEDREATTLELDELWSFVSKKVVGSRFMIQRSSQSL